MLKQRANVAAARPFLLQIARQRNETDLGITLDDKLNRTCTEITNAIKKDYVILIFIHCMQDNTAVIITMIFIIGLMMVLG